MCFELEILTKLQYKKKDMVESTELETVLEEKPVTVSAK
jgi:hypothetical protein